MTKPVTTARLAAIIGGAASPEPEARLLDAAGGNVRLLARVREAFVRQTPRLLAAIREGIDDRNPDAISRNAHTLKGAMSNFTGSDAQSLAAEIEQAGKDGNYVRAAGCCQARGGGGGAGEEDRRGAGVGPAVAREKDLFRRSRLLRAALPATTLRRAEIPVVVEFLTSAGWTADPPCQKRTSTP